jgi:hypothetical protein
MTITPEQIEAVAREMKDAAVVWLYENPTMRPENIPYEMLALVAINAMRPFIRAEALEEAAKVASEREEECVGMPCPDGIKGCAVFHFRRETRPRNHIEIIAAIRALKEKP